MKNAPHRARTLAIVLLALSMFVPTVYLPVTVADEGSSVTYQFHFPLPKVELRSSERLFSIEGLELDTCPGVPSLPVRSVLLALRPGQGLAEVRVQHSVPQSVEIVASYQRNAQEISLDGTVRASNEYDPVAWDLAGSHILEGVEIVCLNLRPLQWSESTGVLTMVTDYTVTLVLESSEITYIGDLDRVRELVDNPEDVPGLSRSTTSSVLPVGSYDYLIITADELSVPFQELADWKMERNGMGSACVNISSVVMTLEDIEANSLLWGVPTSHAGTGNDTQTLVRNFIIAAHQEWGVTYVLLGGDDDVIPCRKVYAPSISEIEDLPADIYFSGLDGDWDDDGDGIYGEPDPVGGAGEEADLLAEAYVGRATVSTAPEAWNFVNKTIQYEGGNVNQYTHDLLLVGEKLDPNTYGDDYKDEVYDEVLADEGLDPPITLYARDGTFSGTAFFDSMESGVHIINHMGHGNYVNFANLDVYDVMGLQNALPFVLYTQACMVAGFDEKPEEPGDSIAEMFIQGEGGAVAFIGNSRYGWYAPGSTEGTSQKFDISFFSKVFDDEVTELGRALSLSKQEWLADAHTDMVTRWVYMELNLLGDPETSILMAEMVNNAPVCDFSYSPLQPRPGEEVHFQDLSSDMDGDVVTWHWEFGDGDTSDLASPVHIYGLKGDYLVNFTVWDQEGANSSKSVRLSVGNEAPHISFSWSPLSIHSKDPAIFRDGSTDVDGSVVAYKWNFGDGNTGTGSSVVHSYVRPGTYLVTLTVVDDDGASNTTSKNLVVLNSPPTASFECVGTVLSQVAVSFNDTSYDREGPLFSWQWNFGDGNGSTASSPTNVYALPGEYFVVLTVTDQNGARDSVSKTILVLNRPPNASIIAPEGDHWSLDLIEFRGNASDMDGTVESYTWDFGDGESDGGEIVQHAYSFPGDFTVTLICVDDTGDSVTVNHTLVVLNLLPTVRIVTEQGTEHPLEVVLTADAEDRDGNVTDYDWSFGDGETAEGVSVVHRYDLEGDFWVNLTVTDGSGGSNRTSALVSVRGGDVVLENAFCVEGEEDWTLEAILSNDGALDADVIIEVSAGDKVYQMNFTVPAGGTANCSMPLTGFEEGQVAVSVITEEGWDSDPGDNQWEGTVIAPRDELPWFMIGALLLGFFAVVAAAVLLVKRR